MEFKTAYLETYGCSANQNNSELLAGLLSNAGMIITKNPEIADLIILNTCVVKGKTESKIKRRIQDLSKEHSKKLLIIAGCMPQTEKINKLKNLSKNAIFLGIHHLKDILNLLRDYQEHSLDEKKQQSYLEDKKEIKLCSPKLPLNKLISIHQISEGCLGECSYCKTRLAKGKLFSYPQEQILKSIKSDLENKAKEIWITSQDNAAYGLDQEKTNLPQLLEAITQLKGEFKIRLGMADPNNVLPILKELIEIFKNKKIYKFLHIPIQSASNKILKDMKRFYTIEQAEKIIQEFRKAFPEIVIATDIIVGYPTETEQDHTLNKEFLEKYAPQVLNISKFSSHKQTPAGKLKTLPGKVISKRARELMEIHRRTAKLAKQVYLNQEIKVFVNKRVENSQLYQARDENYNLVLIKSKEDILGKNIAVKIAGFGVHNLLGEE